MLQYPIKHLSCACHWLFLISHNLILTLPLSEAAGRIWITHSVNYLLIHQIIHWSAAGIKIKTEVWLNPWDAFSILYFIWHSWGRSKKKKKKTNEMDFHRKKIYSCSLLNEIITIRNKCIFTYDVTKLCTDIIV